MANIHISALLQQPTNISHEQLRDVNGGAIALPAFLNQANKAKSDELRSYAFAILDISK